MRPILIAAAMLSTTSAADAQQRIVTHGPAGQTMPAPAPAGKDWGERSGGYWEGGLRAPGGYRAYHRPVRGFVLPGYWIAPTFLIGDWSRYGLQRPPVGYRWSRYYDDAVLVDARGAVFDSVEGVDWDRGDRHDQAYAGGPGAGYPPPPPPGGYAGRAGDYYHRDSGAGGALAGAAVGGAVGAIAGGRHERLGGALVGAGAGALAGYAIDRSEDSRRERMVPPPYGAGYPQPGGYGMGGYLPAPGYPNTIVTPGGTTVTTTTSGGGYYGGGVTTVVVQNAPIVTTTTTETIEDSVTYTRPVWRRVYVKRRWHRPSKLQCRCGR